MRFTKSTPIHMRNEYIDNIVNKRNIVRLEDYINQTTRLKWKCVTCQHEWRTPGTSIIHGGTGCPECYNRRRGSALTQSKGEAKRAGEKTYFTGRPCKHGHTAKRFTTTGECTECASLRHKKWVRDNPEKQRTLNERHKGQRRLNIQKRYNKERKQQPLWADASYIRSLYSEASALTKETEINHHVHHIIPLQEYKDVCGLHCENNLIILTEEEHKWYHSSKERLRLFW